MTDRVTSEMLEAATHVAAWSGDWIHSDSLAAIYEAMKAADPELKKLRDDDADAFEFEIALQEAAFVHGAQACREMMARFVECESSTIANSIRLNWHPGWGADPGHLPGSIPHNAFGETATTDAMFAALAAGAQSAETNEDLAQSEGRQSGPKGNAQKEQPHD